jgi:hypothetical protein
LVNSPYRLADARHEDLSQRLQPFFMADVLIWRLNSRF